MRIKELRKEKNISQTELANATRISQKCISNYEKTDNQAIEILIRLADYFNVSIDYLVGRRQFNKLDMSNLTATQKSIINMTIELNEINANRVESYIIAKLEEQEENKENFKKQAR